MFGLGGGNETKFDYGNDYTFSKNLGGYENDSAYDMKTPQALQVASPGAYGSGGMFSNSFTAEKIVNGGGGYDVPKLGVDLDFETVGGADAGGGWLSRQGIFGGKDKDGNVTGGWASPALSLASGIANTWLGLKNLQVAEDTLDFQKDSFAQNFAAARTTTNNETERRAKARHAANPEGNLSAEDYMKTHAVV